MKRGRKQLPHKFLDGVEHKWCGACRDWLTLDNFPPASPNKPLPDGLRSQCRKCKNRLRREWVARAVQGGKKFKNNIPPGTRYVRLAYLTNGKRHECSLYKAWTNMFKRCKGNGSNYYKWYKAKGIKVCHEWREYEPFRAWALANGFRKGLSLDRIDSDGDYEPSNCRWATSAEQQWNTGRTIRLTLNGVTKPLPQWAEELGVSRELLRTRRSSGWTDEQILTTPKLTNGNYRPDVQHKPRGRKPKSSFGYGYSHDSKE